MYRVGILAVQAALVRPLGLHELCPFQNLYYRLFSVRMGVATDVIPDKLGETVPYCSQVSFHAENVHNLASIHFLGCIAVINTPFVTIQITCITYRRKTQNPMLIIADYLGMDTLD